MGRPLEPYHHAWLSVHPNRTEAWLVERLADGFHVHHKDGNHGNDDPMNLVLIDGVDHLRLHGMRLTNIRRRRVEAPPKRDSMNRLVTEGPTWTKKKRAARLRRLLDAIVVFD